MPVVPVGAGGHDVGVGAATADGSGLAAYRSVLGLPGVGRLSAVAFLARIPATATGIVLTLHVVLSLREGYAAAGVVGAAGTIGMAVGSPLLGRLIDRRGLRPVLALTGVAEAVYWTVAPLLPYPALLVGALLGGVLGLPVFAVVRQSLAAVVPPGRRRTAFALDSMSVELSFIIGPAVGTVLALQLSTSVALWIIGAGWSLSGLALWLLNPPVRSGAEDDTASDGPPRGWLDLRVAAALLGTTAAIFTLFGTELSMIAGLQRTGQAAAIPVVNAAWCLASLTGGFVFGAARRSAPLPGLVGVLGAATLLVSLAGPWWSYLFLLTPAGLLCAPSLAASSERISALAPAHARGLATGLQGSSITVGAALATPTTGLLIDMGSPSVAVLAVGTIGVAGAAVAALLSIPGAGRARASARGRPSAASQPVSGTLGGDARPTRDTSAT